MGIALGELAVRFGCQLSGDPDVVVDHVAPLQSAGPGALSFLANPRWHPAVRDARLGRGARAAQPCGRSGGRFDRRQPARAVRPHRQRIASAAAVAAGYPSNRDPRCTRPG